MSYEWEIAKERKFLQIDESVFPLQSECDGWMEILYGKFDKWKPNEMSFGQNEIYGLQDNINMAQRTFIFPPKKKQREEINKNSSLEEL